MEEVGSWRRDPLIALPGNVTTLTILGQPPFLVASLSEEYSGKRPLAKLASSSFQGKKYESTKISLSKLQTESTCRIQIS